MSWQMSVNQERTARKIMQKAKGLEDSRPFQIRVNTAPRDKISMILPRCRVKLLSLGAYPSHFAPTEPTLPQNRSVDPTGFEPASATVARCYVSFTPRAQQKLLR